MKFTLEVILIAFATYITQLFFLPWWTMVIAAGIIGFLFRFENSAKSYAAGFLAIGTLWSILLYLTSSANAGILAEKIASIFQLSTPMLFAVTIFIGSFLGGLGAMTGTLGRKLFTPKVLNQTEIN